MSNSPGPHVPDRRVNAPAGDWTAATVYAVTQMQHRELAERMDRQLMNLKASLQERYDSQTKAVDAAFVAQTKAMETALIAADKAVQAALAAAKEAVNKAEVANDKRFEAVNEFRAQLADQTKTFISRSEVEAAIERNTERIQELADRMNIREGERTSSLGDSERIRALTQRADSLNGRQVGLHAGWSYLLGAIGLLSSVVALVIALAR